MKKINNNELDEIIGGATSLSGSVITALKGIIELLFDAGKNVGSSLRRLGESNLCPLE